MLKKVAVTALLACLSACAANDTGAGSKDEEWGMEGPLLPTPPPGKEDSQNRKGLLVATNTTATQVWSARNKWEDKDTPAAKKAGLAWGESSGLNWDEKYGKWLESLERTRGTAGWYDTFTLTTPWGKSVPSPALECAEMSVFLRVTFAAWYELPLFFETGNSQGVRIYVGHNGVRTASGKYATTPDFALKYKDNSAMTPAQYNAAWPKDTALRARRLWDSEDNQDMLGIPGATIGTYLDEIHLNKRAGHFTVFALDYLSSVNIADTANTFNVVPEAVRAGDTLLHRWQRNGIGHTLVVKDVNVIAEGNLDVTLLSGSMPRRQGKWETGAASKSYFVTEDSGGLGTNDEGDDYAKLGGGLKRWRVAKNIGGYWTNTFMTADEASWINSTDYARIGARPERFGTLLGEVSPEQTRDELIAQIADARRHLQNFPASCSARERRERAFDQLYVVSTRLGKTKLQVDQANRQPIDYVLAELDYTKSKTCCWNSSTAQMGEIIKEYADKEIADGVARGQCVRPTVFMSQSDGYARWQAYAESTGRGAQWKAWSEDETCAQRAVPSDTERAHAGTDLCLLGAGGGGGCSDAMEPNNAPSSARSLGNGLVSGLLICAGGDVDFFVIPAGGTVKLSFTHSASGDIDMEGFRADGSSLGKSDSATNEETLVIPAGGKVKVYGYSGSVNTYSIRVN